MHLKKLQLSLLIALLAWGSMAAQDIHFTQYNMSPLTLNPANTGAFEGTVRLGGIYRSQWTSVLKSNQFETPSAWVDAPIMRGFRKYDWIGAGMMLFQDKVGAGQLVHNTAKLSAAYHLALDKRRNTILTVGAQYGPEKYQLNGASELHFEKGLKPAGIQYDNINDLETVNDSSEDNPNSSFTDITVGATLSARLNKNMDVRFGYSLAHIGKPKVSLLNKQYTQSGRSVVHGTFNIKTSDRLTISPSFVYQTISKQDEIMVQGLAGYLFNPEKDITLNAGLGYRLGDAINIMAGAKVKSLTVGVAYDVNTSGLNSDTRYRGGFEIAANYIIKIYKKSVIKPKMLCPRF